MTCIWVFLLYLCMMLNGKIIQCLIEFSLPENDFYSKFKIIFEVVLIHWLSTILLNLCINNIYWCKFRQNFLWQWNRKFIEFKMHQNLKLKCRQNTKNAKVSYFINSGVHSRKLSEITGLGTARPKGLTYPLPPCSGTPKCSQGLCSRSGPDSKSNPWVSESEILALYPPTATKTNTIFFFSKF